MELHLVVNVSLKNRSYAFVEQPFCYIQIKTSKTWNIEFTLTNFGFWSWSGADPEEVKWVNVPPPPPHFFWALCFLFSLIPQILIGSITLLQKITPHFKILDPRLLSHILWLDSDIQCLPFRPEQSLWHTTVWSKICLTDGS